MTYFSQDTISEYHNSPQILPQSLLEFDLRILRFKHNGFRIKGLRCDIGLLE